ncbi:MAG: DUF3667 domain-containing protein [Gemmatimonadetes bacterium]|nr:DUF3667 domain-containing protein [Gemmatimonadota bacterium]
MDSAEQESHTCLNCGAALTGPYCAACGQPDSETNITLRGMVVELAEEVLNWDSRFLTSVRHLLLKPGFLTTEYFAGHRARHASPFRLFLLGSVLFLAAVGITGRHLVVAASFNVPWAAADSAGGASSSMGSVVAAGSGRIEVDTAGAVTHGGLLGRIERGAQVLNRDPERTKRLWFHSFVWALFLLVPVFALLLRLVFAGGGVHYPGHLVLALHLHAVGFLVGTALLLLAMASDPVTGVLAITLLAGLFLYFVLALRRVYGAGAARTLMKAAGITGVYGALLLATLASINLTMMFLAA